MQRFQRLSLNPDDIFRTKIKITWLSVLQLCFQPEFDDENFKDIEEQVKKFLFFIQLFLQLFLFRENFLRFNFHIMLKIFSIRTLIV